jgi:hypothetical protein
VVFVVVVHVGHVWWWGHGLTRGALEEPLAHTPHLLAPRRRLALGCLARRELWKLGRWGWRPERRPRPELRHGGTREQEGLGGGEWVWMSGVDG